MTQNAPLLFRRQIQLANHGYGYSTGRADPTRSGEPYYPLSTSTKNPEVFGPHDDGQARHSPVLFDPRTLVVPKDKSGVRQNDFITFIRGVLFRHCSPLVPHLRLAEDMG